jgi:hypothetical protein
LHTSTPQHSALLAHVGSPLLLHVAGARHVPVWQVRPAQQSLSVEQLCVLARHVHARVVLPSQIVEPQHCSFVVHVLPTAWQQRRTVGESSHRRPPQQSVATAQPIGSPAGRHATGRRQVPLWQVVPVQHSEESTHEEPSAWQRQRIVAVSQSMYPQHCADVAHEPP